MLRRARIVVLCLVALSPASMSSGATRSGLASPAIHASFASAVATCGGDAACAARAVRAETNMLGSRIAGARADGLGGWLRLAARLHRGEPGALIAPALGAPEAILSLYDALDVGIDADLRARVHRAVAALDPHAADHAASLIGAVAHAQRVVDDAVRDSGVRALDPERAMRLASLVASAPPAAVEPRLVAEWERVARALATVDMDAVARAAVMLADVIDSFRWEKGTAPLDLPLIFLGGAGDTVHADDRVIMVDEGGNDTYSARVGAGFIGTGVGIAIDQGDGDDSYGPTTMSQGFALGGVGILVDEGGTDSYALQQFGQGASVGGVGVLVDRGAADDVYLSPYPEGETPIGTKAATLGGIGLLIDEGGSDLFHQDSLDGLIWGAGGGVVLLASLGGGDDVYRSDSVEQPPLLPGEPPLGAFAGPVQISAEVNGAAILYEESGNDTYTCGEFVRQGCQGEAGAGSLSLLWDVDGDDSYWMGESVSGSLHGVLCGDTCEEIPVDLPIFPMGQGGGYGVGLPPGHEPALGILYDEAGRDRYTAAEWAQGYGTFNGYGLLYDTGAADDVYSMQAPLTGARADGQTWVDGILGAGVDE